MSRCDARGGVGGESVDATRGVSFPGTRARGGMMTRRAARGRAGTTGRGGDAREGGAVEGRAEVGDGHLVRALDGRGHADDEVGLLDVEPRVHARHPEEEEGDERRHSRENGEHR